MAQIDATVIVGILILADMTTINQNVSEQSRIAKAFAITWELILPFAIFGILALAGQVKISKILTAVGFGLVIIILFAAWQDTYPR